MSSHATTLAQLVDTLTSDLPFGPLPVEEHFGIELERLERSNQFFTLYQGDCEGGQGVRRVEVRQPTLLSLERGKQGLVLLTACEDIDQVSLQVAFPDLVASPVAPFPGDSLDLIELVAEREWGRITVAVDRRTQCVRTILLDTSP